MRRLIVGAFIMAVDSVPAMARDHYAITLGGGTLSMANRGDYQDWVDLRRDTHHLPFKPLHDPWSGHVGFEIFRGARERAQLSIEGLYATRQTSDSAGTGWMAMLTAFSMQSEYAFHLVKAPSWCVPYLGGGLGYEEVSFGLNETQTSSYDSPGAFQAKSGGGFVFGLAGFDAFVSSGVAVGIRAEYRVGPAHRMVLESAGPSEIANLLYLPLARDVRDAAPSAWREMRCDPSGWWVFLELHFHVAADGRPGLVDESRR